MRSQEMIHWKYLDSQQEKIENQIENQMSSLTGTIHYLQKSNNSLQGSIHIYQQLSVAKTTLKYHKTGGIPPNTPCVNNFPTQVNQTFFYLSKYI